jgi:SEC-C motif-containing protein
MTRTDTLCPCQSGRAYAQCCAPLHRGEAPAGNAEALMRSRYCAYVRADAAYLLATWHASTRPPALEFGEAAATRWPGLLLKRHQMPYADLAFFDLLAGFWVGGAPAVRLHEISRFVREHGRWYYLDGAFPPPR